MKSIETTAKIQEDGTVILKINSFSFRPGIHNVILVIEENSIIGYSNKELNRKDKLRHLLDSVLWDNEQYERWLQEKRIITFTKTYARLLIWPFLQAQVPEEIFIET